MSSFSYTKKALIVDDVEISRYSLRAYLHMLQFEVKEAQDEVEAMQLCESFRPDLILMDWHLKKTTAKDLIPSIRSKYHPTPKIMIVSGVYDEQEIPNMDAVQPDGFIAKPVKKDTLKCALQEMGML